MQSNSTKEPATQSSTSECTDEGVTKHYAKTGPGPVDDMEVIVLAVFKSTPLQGDKLGVDAISRSNFAKSNVSVARQSFTSHSTFWKTVVEPRVGREGDLVGVACVGTKVVRGIRVSALNNVRGVCVTDVVEEGDHDGHAALGESEAFAPLSPTKRGALRGNVLADLADAFGAIRPLDGVFAEVTP